MFILRASFVGRFAIGFRTIHRVVEISCSRFLRSGRAEHAHWRASGTEVTRHHDFVPLLGVRMRRSMAICVL